MKRVLLATALLTTAFVAPATAQMGGRLSVEPYVGYGFFGQLPENGPKLESALAYGGRVGYQLSPQFAAYGEAQRSQPEVEGALADKATVDNWSVGAEFSYVPRGGAEGMLPIMIEAGLGQARYDFENEAAGGSASSSDLAVKLGIASALQFTPRLGVRYGAGDYISNFNGDGMVNQIFVRAGAEFTF